MYVRVCMHAAAKLGVRNRFSFADLEKADRKSKHSFPFSKQRPERCSIIRFNRPHPPLPPLLIYPVPPHQIATAYSDQIGAESLMEMFESFKLYEGLFYYLGAIVNNSTEPNVHFRYIEAAAKMQQFKEVERVCRDSTVYEAEKVTDDAGGDD